MVSGFAPSPTASRAPFCGRRRLHCLPGWACPLSATPTACRWCCPAPGSECRLDPLLAVLGAHSQLWTMMPALRFACRKPSCPLAICVLPDSPGQGSLLGGRGAVSGGSVPGSLTSEGRGVSVSCGGRADGDGPWGACDSVGEPACSSPLSGLPDPASAIRKLIKWEILPTVGRGCDRSNTAMPSAVTKCWCHVKAFCSCPVLGPVSTACSLSSARGAPPVPCPRPGSAPASRAAFLAPFGSSGKPRSSSLSTGAAHLWG